MASHVVRPRSAVSPLPGRIPAWRTVWPWLAAASSGCLLAFCFPRWDQEWLCWVALAPLLCAVWFSHPPAANRGAPGIATGTAAGTGAGAAAGAQPRRAWARAALLGYVAGLVFFTMAFSWLGSLAELMENPFLFGIPPLLALYMAVYFAFWSWFVWLLPGGETSFLTSGRNLRIAALGASAWVAHEWVRGWLFTGFGWDGLGIALHRNLPMIQIAEWTGVAGLSFLIAFANLIAVITVRRFIGEFGRRRLRPHWDFTVMMSLVMLTFGYGMQALVKKPAATPAGTALRVASVQANIPQEQKFDDAFEQKIFERYDRLTRLALSRAPQLLIWPEAATPQSMFADAANQRFVLNLAAQGDFNFLLGNLDWDERGTYNVAVLLAGRDAPPQIYRKIHLVPFGEFIPFRETFPLFAWFAGAMVPGDILPGNEHKLLVTEEPPLNLAPLICFEDTLADLTRRFVRNGAAVLVNVTNDGWFLRSAGAEQHLANAVFRAVENRRPLLRSANTGVTCFIDTRGRITHVLRAPDGTPFVEGILFGTVEVPEDRALTFFTLHGEWLSIACAAITCGWLLFRRRAPGTLRGPGTSSTGGR